MDLRRRLPWRRVWTIRVCPRAVELMRPGWAVAPWLTFCCEGADDCVGSAVVSCFMPKFKKLMYSVLLPARRLTASLVVVLVAKPLTGLGGFPPLVEKVSFCLPPCLPSLLAMYVV